VARSRDYRAEQHRRNDLALKRGFLNRSEERRYRRRARNRAEVDELPAHAQEARLASLRAVSILREDASIGLEAAAIEAGTTAEAVEWYAGDALYRESGSWRTTRADRILRTMKVHTNGESFYVDIRGSRKASEVGAYHAAVGQFLTTGDETVLWRFQGKTVAGLLYETDPAVLEEMARRGLTDLDGIYRIAGT
jgi:hypothetical protein